MSSVLFCKTFVTIFTIFYVVNGFSKVTRDAENINTQDSIITIGIVDSPISRYLDAYDSDEDTQGEKNTMIPSSYVKFIEMAGAQTLRIPFYASHSRLKNYLKHVNGLLLTGGSQLVRHEDTKKVSFYQQQISYMLKIAKQFNKKGTYFPVYGICNGFYQMVCAFSKDEYELKDEEFEDEILNQREEEEDYNHREDDSGEDDDNPFEGTENVASDKGKKKKCSVLVHKRHFGSQKKVIFKRPFMVPFERVDEETAETLEQNDLLTFYHSLYLTQDGLENDSGLQKAFEVTSTSSDSRLTDFISSIKHKGLPFFATVFHPEKSIFEWKKSYVSHTEGLVQFGQEIASFFVSEARKNSHQLSKKMQKDTIEDSSKVALLPTPSLSYGSIYIFEYSKKLKTKFEDN